MLVSFTLFFAIVATFEPFILVNMASAFSCSAMFPPRCCPLKSEPCVLKSASIFQKSFDLKSRIARSRSYTKPQVGVWHGPIDSTPLVRTRSRTDSVTYLVNAAPIFRSSIWRASAAIAMFSSGSTRLSNALLISFLERDEKRARFTGALDTFSAMDFASKPIFSPSLSKSHARMSSSASFARFIMALPNCALVMFFSGGVSRRTLGSTSRQLLNFSG